MSYIISEQRVKQFNSTQNRTEYSASIICDDVASLPTNNSDYWYLLGSDAKVISNGKRYIINSSGIWVEQPSENAWENVYTKAEVDAMINMIYNTMMYYHTEQESTDGTITFYTLGGNVGTWTIYGNGQQTGTPTPQNIIMPTFCGVRTGNLWDEDYTGISGDLKYVPVFVGEGTFTLSTDTPDYSRNAPLFLLSGNVTSGASTPVNGVYNGVSGTTDSSNGYITIAFRLQSESTNPMTHKTMLNSGSTALPYEPYGYKIPLTCAAQTNNVYLSAPLRKAIDGTDAVDTLESTGIVTRNVDENGGALVTPTTETITVPAIPTVQGENILTVDTDLKPSKIVISGESN